MRLVDTVTIIGGDCFDVLPKLESNSINAIITDPPYPCIKRNYGYWTEAEWFAMMRRVVPECMRVLKPTGSAVFILQPNSERVGRLRTWLWEFLLWVGKEWGIVQDMWWWNPAALPTGATQRSVGLTRASLKACVWIGGYDCWRNQDAVLWDESQSNQALRATARCGRVVRPSGHSADEAKMAAAAVERGGVTPFNVLPIANTNSTSSAGSHGHGAGTPLQLLRWWTRYICPPDGIVLDPFLGSGTAAVACLREGRRCVGIEKQSEYAEVARKRVAEELAIRIQE